MSHRGMHFAKDVESHYLTCNNTVTCIPVNCIFYYFYNKKNTIQSDLIDCTNPCQTNRHNSFVNSNDNITKQVCPMLTIVTSKAMLFLTNR